MNTGTLRDDVGRIWVGCSGWSYPDWVGPFYPAGTPSGEFLERYARAFSFVEVDSSHYAAPEPMTVQRWDRATPNGFRFAVKAPGLLTHDARLRASRDGWTGFIESLEPLRSARKLACVLLQLPASFRRPHDEPTLIEFLSFATVDVPIAVEVRDPSWWTPRLAGSIATSGAAFVWSMNQYAKTPPVRVGPFVYARFIGDRALRTFDRVQRPPPSEFHGWAPALRSAREETEVYTVVNNHLMGFAPESARVLCRSLGEPLPELTAASRRPDQSHLGDF